MKQPLTSLLWYRLEPGHAHANPFSWKRLWHEWINLSLLASNNLALPNDKWNPNYKRKQGCAWKGLGQFSDQGGELGNTAYSLVLWDIRGNTQQKTLAKHRSGKNLIEGVHYVTLVLSFLIIEFICWIAFSTITEETEYIFDLSGPWSSVGKITAIC